MRSWIKANLPFIAQAYRLGHRAFNNIRYGYRRNRGRIGPADYTNRFDHESLGKARESILWEGDWDLTTAATVQVLEDLALMKDGMTVVDYGCGIGRLSVPLLEKWKINLIAVDRSAEMREHFGRYVSPEVISERGVRLLSDDELLSQVPQLDGQVDLLLFVEVVQHIPEPILNELLPQLFRTLAPNGRAFVIGNRALDHRNTPVPEVATVLRRHSTIESEWVLDEVGKGGNDYKFPAPRSCVIASRLK